jgi:cytoskeletal protein CcmA (bactofilin family)
MSEPPTAPAEDELLVELNALLGRGTEYAGKLSFEGRVRIEGRFHGEIRGDVLVIGRARRSTATSRWRCAWSPAARFGPGSERATPSSSTRPAVVHGDLHAPNVFIDRGVQFEGACKMAPLDERTSAEDLAERAAREATDPIPDDDDAPVLGAGSDRSPPQDPT